MKESARYIKLVEWSEEDQCFVGQCPGIIGPCCHGPDETEVYRELCQIVEEWTETMKRDGKKIVRHRIPGLPKFGAWHLFPPSGGLKQHEGLADRRHVVDAKDLDSLPGKR